MQQTLKRANKRLTTRTRHAKTKIRARARMQKICKCLISKAVERRNGRIRVFQRVLIIGQAGEAAGGRAG